MRLHLVFVTGLVALGAWTILAQAPQARREEPPSPAQLRDTVSRLRGNRIATPNNYDTLTPEQKKYVESILSGPRADISGPLGVMMVTPALGDLAQKAIAYARFAGREGFSTVPPKLNELAILVVAKHWSAEYRMERAPYRRGPPGRAGGGRRGHSRGEAAHGDGEGRRGDLQLCQRLHVEARAKRRHAERRETGAQRRPRRGRSGWDDGAVSDLVDDGGARSDAAAAGQEAVLSIDRKAEGGSPCWTNRP